MVKIRIHKNQKEFLIYVSMLEYPSKSDWWLRLMWCSLIVLLKDKNKYAILNNIVQGLYPTPTGSDSEAES